MSDVQDKWRFGPGVCRSECFALLHRLHPPDVCLGRLDRRSDSRVADSRVVEAKPASRDGRDWTPAAAFTDRAAANRLASSIEKQGYPVEIRQDGSSSRPWVVWIGAQPSGGSRRR